MELGNLLQGLGVLSGGHVLLSRGNYLCSVCLLLFLLRSCQRQCADLTIPSSMVRVLIPGHLLTYDRGSFNNLFYFILAAGHSSGMCFVGVDHHLIAVLQEVCGCSCSVNLSSFAISFGHVRPQWNVEFLKNFGCMWQSSYSLWRDVQVTCSGGG